MDDTTTTTNRAEAERLLGIAEKLLQTRDLNGSKDFAILAQETEPLLDGSDQILAIADVLLSAEKRINNHHDWYSILQIDRRSDESDLIKKQYRRLALLLHPDKNKFALADQAFKLVADAWAVLSDSSKKSLYDNELSLYSKIDLASLRAEREQAQASQKLPVRRTSRSGGYKKKGATAGVEGVGGGDGDFNGHNHHQPPPSSNKLSSFWTACPYCYILYEYPGVYEGCCLRCQNCQRAFHAALIPSLPPMVPGKDAYHCCWAFFPLGFTTNGKTSGTGFPNWMPPMFNSPETQNEAPPPVFHTPQPRPVFHPPRARNDHSAGNGGGDGFMDVSGRTESGIKRKRGRPRKYPVQG